MNFQTSKQKTWQDAEGNEVPFKFVPVIDRKKESLAEKLHKASIKCEAQLSDLHQQMNAAVEEIREAVLEEYKLKGRKESKGNITWYNFDRSLKVEAALNDISRWDEALMTEAKELLDDYIRSSMSDANELISGLVSSAFSNTKGSIDSSKVFQILKFEGKIKDKRFLKACEMMKRAQQLDRTKKYMRIWRRAADGQYETINLNFSSL